MSQGHAAVVEPSVSLRHGRFHLRGERWLGVIGVPALALTAIGLVLLARHWPFSRLRVVDALHDDFHGAVTSRRFLTSFWPHPVCVSEPCTLGRPGALEW